jgi:hypothetical protein
LTNISNDTVVINDLGIELPTQVSLDIRPRYSDEQILGSSSLIEAIDARAFSLAVDGVSTTFPQLVVLLTYLNRINHETLPTLIHEISQPSFYTVTRDSKGLVASVIGYTDETMVLKVREEIYTRIPNSIAITSITTHQYNTSGNIVSTEINYPMRDTTNKISNYTATKS